MVSVLITDAFIGEEVKPKKKHHQAYTPMGEKKPGVVYKRKYRKVEDRIQPIATQLPEEFCIVRNIIGDPLENMPILLMHPPDFVPSLRYTQERYEKLQLNPDSFLWLEEEKLAHHLVREQEECLSWIEEEKGEFCQDFFPLVRNEIQQTSNLPSALSVTPAWLWVIQTRSRSCKETSIISSETKFLYSLYRLLMMSP
jgi:hypothetical protein